jgi:hypothetical protein
MCWLQQAKDGVQIMTEQDLDPPTSFSVISRSLLPQKRRPLLLFE